ncbi:hypothetical protein ES703_29579 [subsurface metagenome]
MRPHSIISPELIEWEDLLHQPGNDHTIDQWIDARKTQDQHEFVGYALACHTHKGCLLRLVLKRRVDAESELGGKPVGPQYPQWIGFYRAGAYRTDNPLFEVTYPFKGIDRGEFLTFKERFDR